MLTKSILKNISNTNIAFENYTFKECKEIDLIIGGGGFNGFYVFGFQKILKKLEKENKIVVQRYAGTSVGAICSVLIACKVTDDQILELYDKIKHNHEFLLNLRDELKRILPANAYILCTNRVFISMTTFPFLQNQIISEFNDNDELIDACIASSCMPLFVTNRLYYKFRNKYYLDGFISKNLIVFNDNKREQLIIQPHKVEYNLFNRFKAKDSAIAGLIVKGAIDAESFFSKKGIELPCIMWFALKSKCVNLHSRLSSQLCILSSGVIVMLCMKTFLRGKNNN
jgi:hypothetical protein